MLTLSTLKLLSLSSEMGIRYPRTLSRSWMNLKTREEKLRMLCRVSKPHNKHSTPRH